MQINSAYIPEELHVRVLDFIIPDIEKAMACEIVCTLWNKILADNKSYQKDKEFHVYKWAIPGFDLIPKNIVEAFGGPKKLYRYPCLDLGDKIRDYIDFIKADQMNAPIMRGIDAWKRPFICIKIVETDNSNYLPFVVTFFSRYRDELDFRCVPGRAPGDVFGDSPGISEKHVLNIKKLVEQRKIEGYSNCYKANYSYRLSD